MTERAVVGAADLPDIATFWIGPRLPDFHRLCVASWMAQGHRVRFFSYEPVDNLPPGVESCDAETVFPRARLADPALKMHVVIQSDIWRLAMLQKGLGVWCDPDVLLFRPISRPSRLLLGVERHGSPCVAVMWWPADHPCLAEIMAVFDRVGLGPWSYAKPRWRRFLKLLQGRRPHFRDYSWNHWGRHAFEYYVKRYKLQDLLSPYQSFYSPEAYDERPFIATSYGHLLEDPRVVGLHCFYKPDAAFRAAPADSLIGWARERYRDAVQGAAPPGSAGGR